MNQKISKTAHIKELNAEIDRLKAELFATREKNGVYLPTDQFQQREESSKATQIKLEMLEAELEQTILKHKTQMEKVMQRVASLEQVTDSFPLLCEVLREFDSNLASNM